MDQIQTPPRGLLWRRTRPRQATDASPRSPRFRWAAAGLIAILCAIGALSLRFWWTGSRVTAPVEVFQGVTYSCFQLPVTERSGGWVHVLRVNLSAPGIGIYVTPEDDRALARGFQYRLATASSVASKENLAVVVNGGLFTSDPWSIPLSGDWARSVDTIVCEHRQTHFYPHNFLIWFADDLTPYIEESKPPSEQVLLQARFAIGSQMLVFRDGSVVPQAHHWPPTDRQTAIGVDTDAKMIWLAVFERANGSVVAETLSSLGAKRVAMLDGGDSTMMHLGRTTAPIRTGTLLGGHRPVATFLGVRAKPLEHAVNTWGQGYYLQFRGCPVG